MSERSSPTDSFLRDYIVSLTGASVVTPADRVQTLWSGYGEIRRYRLAGVRNFAHHAELTSVIAKDINPPKTSVHPRGWNTDISHQRKLRSYEVEAQWYQNFAPLCSDECRVASCYGVSTNGSRQVIVMEDLDCNYPRRISQPSDAQIKACLNWLANFHAKFLGVGSEGLWPIGSYWHLDTRPDEFNAMPEGKLKQSANWLDRQLSECPHQTLVHGDAKIANFCFSRDGLAVAAVDFQYVGGGPGIKDVAYYLGSCMTEQQLLEEDINLLQFYRSCLIGALRAHQPLQPAEEIADTWLNLYALAWTDFYRFLAGWMPDHPKTHSYTRKLAEQVFADS